MNLEGKLLGNRYEIIEKIGNGGMATVYKAKCHVLNRYVAVKVLRDEFTTDEEFIKRFAAEAQSAASLAHPNIVSIYDVGNEGNLYYIVMELIKGKTLKEIINEDGPLPWKWSVNITIQIASALETAHRNNIIHRDIKPHNIIITEDGIAKVTDFGIAKAVSNSTITAFGTTIGSVHYFSPEHARGGYTDAKSDLYSLGIVMYEMLTGKVPFDADTPVSIALKHMQEEAVEPIKVNPEIPVAVNKIIMKAMKKDVNLRYQSATEMLRDLNKALKDPNGNFVFMQDETNFATQKIPIYNNMEETAEQSSVNMNNKNKKDNKLKKFIKEHKKLSYLIGAILLFFIAFGGTALIGNLIQVKEVQIPDLVNMSKEDAEKLANELKIELNYKDEEYSPTIEAGKIISQDPKYIENYKIKEKSTITVIVSKGQETTTMPKLTGLTKEEALEEIAKANLKADVTEETNKKVEKGYVISQDPAINTKLNAGETIKIVVSSGTGIKETTVPGVIGKKEEEAKNAITAANLKVEIVNEEDSSKETGVVLKQSKDAGTTVEEGTTIVITVNKVSDNKNASIIVNVKSITGGSSTTNNGTTVEEKVSVKVEVVSGTGSGFTKSGISKDGSVSGTITGKGQVTLQMTITDSTTGEIWQESHSMNLNSESSYTFK